MPCSIVEQGIFLLPLDDICNIGEVEVISSKLANLSPDG
jgi:hypothetical protein